MTALKDVLSLDDFEIAAQRHLPPPVFAYVHGGVEDNLSRADNRAAFAYAEVQSPTARKAQVAAGSDDTLTLWVNGKEVFHHDTARSSGCRTRHMVS
mgnify:CR=1 FL=1